VSPSSPAATTAVAVTPGLASAASRTRSAPAESCPLGSLGSELAELDHVARPDVAAGFSRWESAIRACLRGMRDRGQLVPAADPGQLATAMLAALEGGLLLAQVERNTRPLAAALDVMISFTGSLAPPRQQQPGDPAS